MIPYPEYKAGRLGTSPADRDWAVAAAILTIAAVAAFLPTMKVLVEQWITNDTYSFGVLVPPISAYLVWLQRKRLQQLPVAPEPLIGAALVAACAALLVTGRIVGVIGIQEVAMVITLPSMIWLLLGRRYVFALWFPLLYLLLMLPIWEILTDRFHYRFQLFSAGLSERLLSVIDVPVHRHDNYLELPNITLEVASVCSGVNFLIAVIAIGVPQAYLFLFGFVPRALVIGFAVAIAIFSNGLRIAIIGGLSHYELSKSIHGPGHVLQGLFVSGAGLIALQLAVAYLARRYPKPSNMREPGGSRARSNGPAGWQLVSSVIGAAALMLFAAKLQPHEVLAAAPAVAAAHAPVSVPGWRLVNPAQPIDFVTGGPGPNLGQTFQIDTNWTVELFGGELTYPETGGGIGYRRVVLQTRSALSVIPVQTKNGAVLLNYLSRRDGPAETDIVYWYDVDGVATAQVTTAKLTALWDLLSGERPLPRLIAVSRTRVASTPASQPIAEFAAEVFRALELNVVAALFRSGVGPS